MKALTICQPYSELILRGEKRVENRTWPTAYRGSLLIHAGKSRNWLRLDGASLIDMDYHIALADMTFGAIVGIAEIVDCVRLDARDGLAESAHPWLVTHQHAEGPYCFILEGVRRFERPVPYAGKQGLFDVPHEVVEGEVELCGFCKQ